jgi:hypothetical protein
MAAGTPSVADAPPDDGTPEPESSLAEDAAVIVDATQPVPESGVPDGRALEPPTPEGVERYRLRLEQRLLERYNNLPDHAGNIGKVTVVLSRPLEYSMDGSLVKAKFDQIVLDVWGKRLPALEKEYYAVTFGLGGAQTVQSDPSVRIGLDLEKSYSERAPLAADPFRTVEEGDAFRAVPTVKMPEWWRPEFQDDE